jgi:hypothetical protein
MMRRWKEGFKFVREIQAAVKMKIAREIHVLPATSVCRIIALGAKKNCQFLLTAAVLESTEEPNWREIVTILAQTH